MDKKTVLSFLTHPDDTEFISAGTLALLHKKGWQINIATMTPGDCGSTKLNRGQISQIRRRESAKSAKLLGGNYHCLECEDAFILYDKPTLIKAIGLLRKVKPAIVFAPSPSDYMVDHEITSQLVETACFCCGMPNIETPNVESFEPVPHLYYVDALEGKDKFGNQINPSNVIDISSVIDIKEKMLCCHESQRSWLMEHHGIDEYIISMKRFARQRGEMIGCNFAEGFRQHLGHAFLDDNILKKELGNLVSER